MPDTQWKRGGISLSPEMPKLEAATREEIDVKLTASGWAIQDKKRLNLYANLGVAVREIHAFWLARRGEGAPVQQPVHRDRPRVGRNDPCPCGSGKKYKKCCLQ